MIDWQEATQESLVGITEDLLVIYMNARGRYVADIAFPYPQLNVNKIWFCKRDGYALTGVKYWAKINLPKDIEEHNEQEA